MSYPVQRSLSKNNSTDDGKQEAPAPAAKVAVAAVPVEAAAKKGSATAGAAEVRAFLSGCGLKHFARALLEFGVLNSANGLGLEPAQLSKYRKAVAPRAVASADARAAAPAAPVTAASVPSTVRAACEELRQAVGDGSDAWRTLRKIVANIVKVQRFLS